jgi:hypothetical protein
MNIWHDDTLTLPFPKAASVRSKMTITHIGPRPHHSFAIKKGRRFAQAQIAVGAGVKNNEVFQSHIVLPPIDLTILPLSGGVNGR